MNARLEDMLAAADPATATASLPAAHATQLLTSAGDYFYEVMAQHPERVDAFTSVVTALLGRNLPFDDDDFADVVRSISGAPPPWRTAFREPLVGFIERWAAEHELVDGARSQVDALLRANFAQALNARLRALLTVGEAGPQPGEPWAERARADMAAMPEAAQAAWRQLFALGDGVDGARPTARWQREATARVAAIDAADIGFSRRLPMWLPLVEKPKEARVVNYNYASPFSEGNLDALKTLCWAAGAAGVDTAGAVALGDLAATCFSKIPGYGPVSNRIGNAALFALGAQPSFDGVAQLSRLKLRVKYATAQRLIGRALDAAAQRTGLSVDDLEEMAVPTFGLDVDGHMTAEIAGFTIDITAGEPTMVIFRAGETSAAKKPPKSVPKDVKSDPAWKPLKARIADIDKRLPIERERIERLYWSDRHLPFEAFEARYLRHPLVAGLAKRLLWRVADETALWQKGALRDLGGRAVTTGEVSLWHPLGAAVEDIQVWRDLLESEGVVQPFKQAHRETYSLSPNDHGQSASKRFSGHVLRQHQLAALFTARGWRYRLQGAFDSYNTPYLELPRHGLRVELTVDPAGELSGSQMFLHVVTGQLRFVADGEAVALGEIPPLVLSEVFRDVDLFVSVASIGTDPRWRDRGDIFGSYWHEFSFGELSATATTRRDVIAAVVARLPQAGQLSIDGRFLRVRGQRRSYRIHLGSGNVLAEPGDRYLHIDKADSTPPPGVRLPYEGDELAARILATALYLVDDRKLELDE